MRLKLPKTITCKQIRLPKVCYDSASKLFYTKVMPKIACQNYIKIAKTKKGGRWNSEKVKSPEKQEIIRQIYK